MPAAGTACLLRDSGPVFHAHNDTVPFSDKLLHLIIYIRYIIVYFYPCRHFAFSFTMPVLTVLIRNAGRKSIRQWPKYAHNEANFPGMTERFCDNQALSLKKIVLKNQQTIMCKLKYIFQYCNFLGIHSLFVSQKKCPFPRGVSEPCALSSLISMQG